jgi:mono/diheme cytochrome c family protein
MSKQLSMAQVACSLLVVLGGCQGPGSDLDPGPGDDAGQTTDPVVVPDPRGTGRDSGHGVLDAGTPEADAGRSTDAGGELDAAGDAELIDSALPSDDASPPSTFDSVYALMGASCTGCHGAGKTLDLSTPELAHANLVGVSAQYSACAGDGGIPPVRVVAGSPEDSLLLAKLQGTQSCGKQMPPKALLAPEQIELFRAWIAAGAAAR